MITPIGSRVWFGAGAGFHHAAVLSSAIVSAVAETHLNAAAADSFRYTLGV